MKKHSLQTCLIVGLSLAVAQAAWGQNGPPQRRIEGAQARQCSNASLKGAYGFFNGQTAVTARTPFAALGRISFDGKGNFTNTVTFNDNGTVTHLNDFGPYTVNADCTGKIGIVGGTGTIEIVLVDGGKEFYQLLTDPLLRVFLFTAAKKQFPDE